MKDTKSWIIAVLLSVIFTLIGWSVHREIGRLDRTIEVLHQRITGIDHAVRALEKCKG